MNVLQSAARLYSLDILDKRLTTSSKTPPSRLDPTTQRSPDASNTTTKERTRTNELAQGASPPRWKSPEFIYHGLVFLILVPLMFKAVYDVSKPSHPSYPKYAPLLSPGWIPGRKVDNSDPQYASFRDNVPYLLLVMMLHPLLRKLYNSFYNFSAATPQQASSTSEKSGADNRLDERISFDLYFGLVFLVALHGFSVLKVVTILYINYVFAKKLNKAYLPAFTWIFNIGILFANELCEGYSYSNIVKAIFSWSASSRTAAGQTSGANWGSFLDKYGGLIPRWEILFNITVLRLISFNLDYYWSLDRAGGNPIEKKQLDPTNLSERDRVDFPARAEDYSFRNYVVYTIYSPLYLAGPILTFNDYISQQRHPTQSISRERTLLYGIRFLLSLIVMEVMIHFIYVMAIIKAQPAWEVYSPFQLSMLGYFSLHHIWLKLLLPWRFFRLWALVDGTDPPENMVRCASDNYSTLAFWRGWHRSFNRWIVRYIYIPLGGSGGPGTRGKWGQARGILNLLIVFTFVAMWHDIKLKLLVWSWLISLFVLPETVATLLFPKHKWTNNKEAYRVICGIGAIGNILMMMAANLVGFAIGLDGLRGLVQGIVGSYSGLVFLAFACTALFTGVQVMFELREEELRHGIHLKY